MMMRSGWVLTALVGTLFVGCGGSEVAPEEALAGDLQEQSRDMRVQSHCQQFYGSSYESSDAACTEAIQQGTSYCSAYGGVKSRGRLCFISAEGNPYRASNYICCNQ